MMGRCGRWRDFEGIPAGIFAMGWGGHGPRWGGKGPGGWSWGADRGDWGGGRGRRRVFGSSELRLVLLKLISDQPRHGYDLMRAIEELSGGSYSPSPGVVYPSLTMLQDMGLIEQTDGESSRKAFAATAEGRAHLEEKAGEVAEMFERLEGLGEPHRRAGGAPIRRAVGNLLSALWNRVAREDADEDRLHQIAAILDEAAQKIERLK